MPNYLPAFLFALAISSTGCSSSSGEEVNAFTSEKSIAPVKEDTCTYIDLNTGERVKLNFNPKNDITTNAETGEIVRIYVNPVTKDTFDGLNGRKVNHAIIRRTSLGTYGIDMTRVKLEDKLSSDKKTELAGYEHKR